MLTKLQVLHLSTKIKGTSTDSEKVEIAELERVYRITDDIIKFITVKVEK